MSLWMVGTSGANVPLPPVCIVCCLLLVFVVRGLLCTSLECVGILISTIVNASVPFPFLWGGGVWFVVW